MAATYPPDSSVLVQQLVRAAEPWREVYSNSAVVATGVLYVHLAALLVAGGLAISADRATLRTASGDASERSRQLMELSGVHRTVVAALSCAMASGVALLFADLESFLALRAFWIKMGLVILLLLNGAAMVQREKTLRVLAVPSDLAMETPIDLVREARLARLWSRLRVHALASAALWFATLLAGTALSAG